MATDRKKQTLDTRDPRLQNTSTLIISAWPKEGFNKTLPIAPSSWVMPPAPMCGGQCGSPMAGCSRCKPVSRLVVPGTVSETVDQGDDKYVIKSIPDRQLAEDLARESAQFGVMVCEGDEPTQAEIDKAYETRNAFLTRMIEAEDAVKGISGGHGSLGLRLLGMTRTWGEDLRPKQPCEVCGFFNPNSVARCGNATCGAILDWPKALLAGILTDRQIEYAEKLGVLETATVPVKHPKMPKVKSSAEAEL